MYFSRSYDVSTVSTKECHCTSYYVMLLIVRDLKDCSKILLMTCNPMGIEIARLVSQEWEWKRLDGNGRV